MNMNPETVAEQDWVEATPSGATDLTTIEITDTVAAINKQQRTITFFGTGGKTRTIRVDPERAGLQSGPGRRHGRARGHPRRRRQRQARLSRDTLPFRNSS